MKLSQELVDRLCSVKPPKRQFTNNYTSCSMLLHYVYVFTDLQIYYTNIYQSLFTETLIETSNGKEFQFFSYHSPGH